MIHGLACGSLVEDTIPEQTGTQARFPDGERAAVKGIGSPELHLNRINVL